jgi:hypothetical protein
MPFKFIIIALALHHVFCIIKSYISNTTDSLEFVYVHKDTKGNQFPTKLDGNSSTHMLNTSTLPLYSAIWMQS